MTSPEAALKANEVVVVLVILTGVIRHHVLPQGPAEGQLLLEAILQQSIRSRRVLLAQIVDIDDQPTRLLSHHRPDVGGVDALIFLKVT